MTLLLERTYFGLYRPLPEYLPWAHPQFRPFSTRLARRAAPPRDTGLQRRRVSELCTWPELSTTTPSVLASALLASALLASALLASAALLPAALLTSTSLGILPRIGICVLKRIVGRAATLLLEFPAPARTCRVGFSIGFGRHCASGCERSSSLKRWMYEALGALDFVFRILNSPDYRNSEVEAVSMVTMYLEC